jgi:hypothetical protein
MECGAVKNLFRSEGGKLDRKYLRVCSVYRLLRNKIIGQGRALELLAQRHNSVEMTGLRRTVEIWRACSIKDMRP